MANFWDWVNKKANNRYENRFTDAGYRKRRRDQQNGLFEPEVE